MPTSAQSLVELLSLIIIFVLVLVVCYYTTRFVAGRQLVQKKVGNFEVIETFPIAQNKYLQLIRMGNKYVVVSVTKESVTYLTELSQDEICMIQKNTPTSGKNFMEILSGLTKKPEEKQQ